MNIKRRIKKIMRKSRPTRQLWFLLRMFRNVIFSGAYCPRYFFYDNEKKYLYLSVSKAGNTSIKASMYALPEMDDYRDIHKAVNVEKSAKVSLIGNFSDYYKFTFVRNPFDRLVSCYENKMHSDKSSVGVSIKNLIFDNYLLGYLSKDRGFADFARRVCKIPDFIADRHFQSQVCGMFYNNGDMIPDFVGKFENFADDFEFIREKFELAPLPHYNKTKKGNWMDYYDLKTAQLVYRRYQKDIEKFGYQQSYDELIRYITEKKK